MLIACKSNCLTGMINHHLFGDNHEFLNQARGRIDFVLDIKKHNKFRAITISEIDQLLIEKCYTGMYYQSSYLYHFSTNDEPKYFIMDQYCELTDKRFESKYGFVFSGSYGHFNTENLINKDFLIVN